MVYMYGGISGVTLVPESYELGEGVSIAQTYAHLMSPCLMAFSPPGAQGYHPAPWKAASGGFGFDVTIELKVPEQTCLGASFTPHETIWWIAALLRLAKFPYLSVPVLSSHSFSSIPRTNEEPTLQPFETEPRIFKPANESNTNLDESELQWLRDSWIPAGKLLNSHPKFFSAFKAFDSATIRGRTSSSLLALWGGLEQLFAPSKGELRFRVSALLSAYIEPFGKSRFDLYKRTLKLYNERSSAAHTAEEVETAPLIDTYVLMRNTLMQIINENGLPTQEQLEKLLLGWDENT